MIRFILRLYEIACYGDSCPGTPIPLTMVAVNNLQMQNLKFKVFPNPAKKELNVEIQNEIEKNTNKKYIVRIKNSAGQEIFRKDFSKQLKIDTSQFQKGFFLAEVCTAEGKVCHTEKVVIE